MESSIFTLIQHNQRPQTFAAGETVFEEGELGDIMYVVLKGQVEIRVGEKSLEIAGPGTVIGEMALIDLRPRSATVIAQGDCTLAAIDDKQFLSLIVRRPQFALSMLEIMANRLRHMDRIAKFDS
jgi:CRP/FNR family cyclic AMP-dependent transcriptional regulator